MSEKNQRDSFIFYRSFYESIKDLDKNQKAEVLEAICSYALDEYTEPLSGVSKGFFTLIKPQLDANRKRFENGSTKTNFEDLPTITYILELSSDNERFIKIGISCNINQRINNYKRIGYQVEIIDIINFHNRTDAFLEKCRLHEFYAKHKYYPEIDFGGKTECFDIVIKNSLILKTDE